MGKEQSQSELTPKIQLVKTELFRNEGMKRQYFPYVLRANCEKCNNEMAIDFRDEYIPNPYFDEIETVSLWCGECHTQKDVKIIPRLVLELAKDG